MIKNTHPAVMAESKGDEKSLRRPAPPARGRALTNFSLLRRRPLDPKDGVGHS